MNKLLWLAPLLAMGCYKIDYINTGVPAAPGDPVTFTTNSKIVAVEYDDERQFARFCVE